MIECSPANNDSKEIANMNTQRQRQRRGRRGIIGSCSKDENNNESEENEDQEGCCVQLNEHAADWEVVLCTKQTDCDSCGEFEKNGCAWTTDEGECGDGEGDAQLFGDSEYELSTSAPSNASSTNPTAPLSLDPTPSQGLVSLSLSSSS